MAKIDTWTRPVHPYSRSDGSFPDLPGRDTGREGHNATVTILIPNHHAYRGLESPNHSLPTSTPKRRDAPHHTHLHGTPPWRGQRVETPRSWGLGQSLSQTPAASQEQPWRSTGLQGNRPGAQPTTSMSQAHIPTAPPPLHEAQTHAHTSMHTHIQTHNNT